MQYLSQRLASKPAPKRGGGVESGGAEQDAPSPPQRERILDAAERLIAVHGCAGTSIEALVKEAGVSSVTFYEFFDAKEECFEGKEDCFGAAYEMIEAHVFDSMLTAPGAAEPWPDRARARLAAMLDVLSRDAAVARCFLIEPLAAGGEIATRYREAMQLLAAALRPEPPPTELNMEIRDQALIGGIATLIVRRLNTTGAARLPELLPDLVELALAPYVGRAEAKRLAAAA